MEADFDIEKWRQENPMDYRKAIEILKIDSSSEAFFTILRIAQLHITKKVYKYYSFTDNNNLNDLKLKTLRNSQIFLSPMSHLNDPFEGKSFFYNERELQQIKRLREHNGKLIDDFSSLSLITSMTKNNVQSMPMWAHYSNNHSGYCVEYDTDDKRNLQLKSLLMPVQYTEERLDVTDIIKHQALKIIRRIEEDLRLGKKKILFDDFMIIWLSIFYSCVKHTSWNYENELRVLVGNSNKQYLDAHPSSIYIGMKCNNDNKEQLVEIANHLNIPAYQMCFNEHSTSFQLNYDLVN